MADSTNTQNGVIAIWYEILSVHENHKAAALVSCTRFGGAVAVSWHYRDNPAKGNLREDLRDLERLEENLDGLLNAISTRLDDAWQADNDVRAGFADELGTQKSTAGSIYDDAHTYCNTTLTVEPDQERYWVDDPILPDGMLKPGP